MECSEGYFESYEDLNVHKLMLQDIERNHAYKKAIFSNKNYFNDKIVLDVGAGTGILSIFCAQAGAKKVYAVEACNIYKMAEKIIFENHFESKIQVIHSKIENVILPEKVDIIVSEWMGFYLLHESMLDSVIYARDQFLKPGGAIFPESATLYSAPCSVPSMFDEWDNVEGISMKQFAEALRSEASQQPITAIVKPEQILADSEVVTWIDLKEITIKELENIKQEILVVSQKCGKYQGICLWFNCVFPSIGDNNDEPVTLSTDPQDPETHWKQTIIVLPMEIEIEDKTPIAYELEIKKDQRKYNIQLTMLDPDTIQHPEYCNCHKTKCILTRAMLEKYHQ